jgi:hypothetical protein
MSPCGRARLVVPEGVDEFGLRHLRAALDADLAGPGDQFGLGAVVVVGRLGTLAADLAARPSSRRAS